MSDHSFFDIEIRCLTSELIFFVTKQWDYEYYLTAPQASLWIKKKKTSHRFNPLM